SSGPSASALTAAAYNARPSSSGMNPGAASAAARSAGSIGGTRTPATLTTRGPASGRRAFDDHSPVCEHPPVVDDAELVDVPAPVVEPAAHDHLEVGPG